MKGITEKTEQGVTENLCGHRFQSFKEIVNATMEAIWDLPPNVFQLHFQQLYQCWQACIAANGNYFEGGCGYVYLVIWCNKTTVHEIADYSSIISVFLIVPTD
jgi:hypothetical protein